MITILVAAAAGLLFSARSGLVFWVVGSSLTAVLCIATAVVGWSAHSVLDAVLGVLAFNASFAAGTLWRVRGQRRLDGQLEPVKTLR